MGKFKIKVNEKGASFTLVASNGEVIGVSEHYTSKTTCKNGIESVKKYANVANIENQTVADVVKQKNPKFEVYKDAKGEFRFRLKAINGENILSSEGYTTVNSCLNGIKSVKNNAEGEVVE